MEELLEAIDITGRARLLGRAPDTRTLTLLVYEQMIDDREFQPLGDGLYRFAFTFPDPEAWPHVAPLSAAGAVTYDEFANEVAALAAAGFVDASLLDAHDEAEAAAEIAAAFGQAAAEAVMALDRRGSLKLQLVHRARLGV